MAMTEERMGQIALAIFRMRIRNEEFDPKRIERNVKRELPNKAQELGIPLEEMKEFGRVIYQEWFDDLPKWADTAICPLKR